MKLSATHTFICIVLIVKFGWTSCEDILPVLYCLPDIAPTASGASAVIYNVALRCQPC